MMQAGDSVSSQFERDRVVVITQGLGDQALVGDLRRRYPSWTVTICDTYLTGIAELGKHTAQAVIVGVDSSLHQVDNAIAGVREAAGPKTKVLLCCSPFAEPIARRLLKSGADDYLLSPLLGEELDEALGFSRLPNVGRALFAAPAASMEELVKLAGMLRHLDTARMELLEQLADLIRCAIPTHGVTVIVEGAVATSGDPVVKPILSAPLRFGKRLLGQITVGEPTGTAFTPADTQKLTHYAKLGGHLLQAASKNRKWRELAFTDELSGLPNRRYFNVRFDEVLERAQAEQFQVTVLVFDIDDFKTYNDRYGHPTGDEIIRRTGQLFRKHCREQDIVARFGGDEFAVVFWDPEGPRMAGSKHPDSALAVLERVTRALRKEGEQFLGAGGVGQLTVSGGLATYPWHGTTNEELLLKADEALLAAKRAGKNRIFLIGECPDPANGESETQP